MSRAQTLVLALLVMNFLLGGLCVAVGRGERSPEALRLWGWGTLMYAFGLAVTQFVFLPPQVRVTLGNCAIAYAPILIALGALRHTRMSMPWRTSWVLFVAAVIALLINNFGGFNLVIVNIAASSPIAVVLFLYCAFALWRRPLDSATSAARFLGACMVVAVVVWLSRIAFLWTVLDGSNDKDRIDFVISLFAIVQIVVSVGCTMALFWIEVRNMEAALTRLAFGDALTGLPNRRATMERFARQVRLGKPFALLVIDIDFFKQVNDRYGHLAGDAVLKHVAAVLSAAKRGPEVLGRIGGEEFVLMIDEPTRAAAQGVADRLREKLAASPAQYEGRAITVTMSGGLACCPEDGEDWDRLFGTADRRLYDAKHGGRNRIVATTTADALGGTAMQPA